MHHISAKKLTEETATVVYENEIIRVDQNVVETIKTRLTDAAGKESRAFELEIQDDGPGYFYHHCHNIKTLDDNDFVERTKIIAELLASSQKRNSIPGGYFIFMDAFDENTNLAVYIVIKAEPHKVLLYKNEAGISKIELLDKVFLSPSQKLFKIAILFEKSIPLERSPIIANTHFGCFLFDDQFRTDGHPAEYFYKDFLGFSVGNNAKIQSKRFYDKTEQFIIENVADYDMKNDLLNSVKLQFNIDQNSILTPSIFAGNVLPENLRDLYTSQIIPNLPSTFVKDSTLIKSQLTKKKVLFPHNIKITGPNDEFDDHVQMFDGSNAEDLDINNPEYTIIRIKGRPFENE